MVSLLQRKKSARNPEDRHPFLDQLEQLWRNKTAVAGLIVITLFVFTFWTYLLRSGFTYFIFIYSVLKYAQ